MPITKPGYYRLLQPNKKLESWAGAHYDLWLTEELLELCGVTQDTQREACWTAAVIKYFRAFSPAHWPANETVLSELSLDHLETHFFMMYLRDQMFTHRLGVGDSYEITASLQLNGAGALELVYVGPMKPERISALGDVLAREFLDLVRTVRTLTTKGFENEKEALLKGYHGRALDQVVKGDPVLQRNMWPKKTDPSFIKYRDRKMAGLTKP